MQEEIVDDYYMVIEYRVNGNIVAIPDYNWHVSTWHGGAVKVHCLFPSGEADTNLAAMEAQIQDVFTRLNIND